MKNIKYLIYAIGLIGNIGIAQVEDISLTISPAAEYSLRDDKSGLENGFLVGGKLGFGFGEYMELRGIYMQSLNLKTNFDNFGLPNYSPDEFTSREVKLTRWGGEFKANIGTTKLKPYVTVGTGVQKLELENNEDLEQIYGSFGLGLKLNLSPRAVFSLEAKGTTYNFNAASSLLTDEDKIAYAVSDADYSRDRVYNWGIQGSLQFYLGGRKPGNLTELDKAYLSKFKGGLKGLQLILEPGMGYIGFNDNSLYRDTYLLGGYAGVDFNEYIGLRGFYFQATENEQISTKFDQLAMYGMEFRARLNDGNGVTPYLMLGGGYLNAYADYLGKENVTVGSGEFATGGLGLNIPLGKRLLISGGVRAMLTSGAAVENVNATDDLQTHLMYNVGLKLSLGKKSVAPENVYNENLNNALEAQQVQNNKKIDLLKLSYQDKLAAQEKELENAYVEKNVEKAVTILESKKKTEEALEEVEKIKRVNQAQEIKRTPAVQSEHIIHEETNEIVVPQSEMIKMTPLEFESLIQRILNTLDRTPGALKTINIKQELEQQELDQEIEKSQLDILQKRIEILEKLLADKITEKAGNTTSIQKQLPVEQNVTSEKTTTKVIANIDDEKMVSAVDNIKDNKEQTATKEVLVSKKKTKVVTVLPSVSDSQVIEYEMVDDDVDINEKQKVAVADEKEIVVQSQKKITYLNSSATLGGSFGNTTTGNLGARIHYDITNLALSIMPEVFVSFGSDISYGVSANVVYSFLVSSDKVSPYVGTGFGYGNFSNDTKGFYNVIIGSSLPFLHKNVYIDYIMRNSFDYNQIAIGYKLPF
ncbi:hypothetical protein I2486_13760 [Cellulophaga sp. E16_2]|uniref:hypothetical protein n=1 Tax=Cellulophaga sp. E16_2 TaxID=2789297 RepID=UPI001A92D1B9|nr:hypothetical protein [Cellulophaga sp. E16_2]MBO0592468.1 hypothetical protein [Cellulophaga sp. E16_2]